ncbi:MULTISPECIES: hypothetical protein [Aerosakkonema]|uniref:hypothetical protein n=1 Tax=Aerosakkonema TaxID=1246629 RepID=UPI0035B9B3B1
MSDTESSIITVWGYHGTSAEAAELIVRDGFRIKSSRYHWLGDGVYFFQDAPLRAWEWANQRYSDPAVIRSLIKLDEDCIDLVDIKWFSLIEEIYGLYLSSYELLKQPLPVQNLERKAHGIDCDFFNFMVRLLSESRGIKVRAIRGVFIEGKRIFTNSAIFNRAHIQISILDTSLIQESYLVEEKQE